MRRTIAGILLGSAILCQPITAGAHDRQCPETINLTEEEAQELLQIAFAEAGNQGASGQAYIMAVVLNRVESPDWPDNIHDVIHQSGQFAAKAMSKAQPTWETHYALAEIEAGNIYPNIIGFERADSTVLDEYFDEEFVYKNHKFYVQKGN